MSAPKTYYVYAYFRPDGSPCYVGKGTGGRWLEHLQNRSRRNPRLVKILERHGSQVTQAKLVENLTNEEASAIEAVLIRLVGRGRRGPLVNMSDGGIGGSAGRIFTPATRAKMSAAMTLRMADPEARRKISERHKGKKGGIGRPSHVWTPEQRADASRRMKGKRLTPEHRANIAAGVSSWRRKCK